MTWTGQSFSVGQVLTAAQMNNLQADITALANGDSGAPPIVAEAIDGDIWTLISSVAVSSGDSSVTFTGMTNSYERYEVRVRDTMVSSQEFGDIIQLNVAHDGVPTWETSSYQYHRDYIQFSSNTPSFIGDNNGGYIPVCIGAHSGTNVCGDIRIIDPSNEFPHILSDLFYKTDNATVLYRTAASRYAGGDITGVKLAPLNGNFISGTMSMFGLSRE